MRSIFVAKAMRRESNLISLFHFSLKNESSAITLAQEISHSFNKEDTICYPTTLAAHSNFSRDAINAITWKTALHFIELEFFNGLCSNISFAGDDRRIEHEFSVDIKIVSQSLLFMADWADTLIQNSWPMVHKLALEELLLGSSNSQDNVDEMRNKVLGMYNFPLFLVVYSFLFASSNL